MNTKIPPFDNQDVRLAVNLAIDRRAALEAWGGERQGDITCQMMPPTLPGYAPYCPFTVGHDVSEAWRVPDVDRARRLIAQAGAVGAPVVVYGSAGPGHKQVAEYMVRLLNELGLDASAHLVDPEEYFSGGYLDADHPADMGIAGWWWPANYPIAATVFLGTFTCPGYPDTPYYGAPPSELCDPQIDSLVTEALELEAAGNRAEANQTWQEVDRRVTNATTLAAILNPADVTFVSPQVGNFQHHLVWGYLLDQMWVR
jgi:peptide/nickel transport system substrate-binding protein